MDHWVPGWLTKTERTMRRLTSSGKHWRSAHSETNVCRSTPYERTIPSACEGRGETFIIRWSWIMGYSSGIPSWQEEVDSGPSLMTIRTARWAMNLQAARDHPGRSSSRAKSECSAQARGFRSLKSTDNRDHSQNYGSDTKIFIANSRINKCFDNIQSTLLNTFDSRWRWNVFHLSSERHYDYFPHIFNVIWLSRSSGVFGHNAIALPSIPPPGDDDRTSFNCGSAFGVRVSWQSH
jgi:hypothetical protein